MKITKYTHSCLLVEDEGKSAVFDPGIYSTEDYDFNKIENLDYIFITHTHPDHFHLPFVQKLLNTYKSAKIISTSEVVKQLNDNKIEASSNPNEDAKFFDAPHEDVTPLFPGMPEEIGIHFLNKLSNPGDSHSFNETKDILALPITAPWGSVVHSLKLAIKLKPKVVLPIHDWHWHEQAREQTYTNVEKVLAAENIRFIKLSTGQTVDVTV